MEELYMNTGYYNTGSYNTGYRNTGHWNTGNNNTGNWNTGSYNTGNWNTGHYNTGYFNTITPDTILVFNKPFSRQKFMDIDKPEWIYFDLTEWVNQENMSDQEKAGNESYMTTGGYLKVYSYKEAWANAYKNATEEDIQKTINLPNFDYDIFEEISGIDLRKHGKSSCCADKVVEIDGKKYKLTEIKE